MGSGMVRGAGNSEYERRTPPPSAEGGLAAAILFVLRQRLGEWVPSEDLWGVAGNRGNGLYSRIKGLRYAGYRIASQRGAYRLLEWEALPQGDPPEKIPQVAALPRPQGTDGAYCCTVCAHPATNPIARTLIEGWGESRCDHCRKVTMFRLRP